jgi:hypothetical protein
MVSYGKYSHSVGRCGGLDGAHNKFDLARTGDFSPWLWPAGGRFGSAATLVMTPFSDSGALDGRVIWVTAVISPGV